MIEGIPRISVLVITYNQEDVIKRAIDSLLAQKDYIYEICVSDDCSIDRTWDILQDYSTKYPGLFVLNRNEPNVGIFENIEKTWTMPTGDIIYQLAGDDECGEGWFKKVVEYIEDNNVDYRNVLFCIYGDYRAVYPNGDSYIGCNSLVTTGIDPFKLSLRGTIYNRSTCYSIRILKKMQHVSQGRSYIAEASQDRQLQIWSEKNFYIPWVGNIYYARIGVSTAISGKRWEENVARWDYLLENLNKWGYSIDTKDRNHVYYRKAQQQGNVRDIIKFWFSGFDKSIGFNSFKFKRTLFAFLRRMPHKKPIKDFRI